MDEGNLVILDFEATYFTEPPDYIEYFNKTNILQLIRAFRGQRACLVDDGFLEEVDA